MAGRAAWVKFVLSALPVYVLIALNVPKWFLKAVNKIGGVIYGEEGKRPTVDVVLSLRKRYRGLWISVVWASQTSKLWDGLSKFVGYGSGNQTQIGLGLVWIYRCTPMQ
ncbi:hypothetical protein PR202_gb08485 [Eleusine coracana subsp. coracana]|uniref:Uncharacterized protein n=1 Tax=Eleusine coracana subsp. coracana TaxID=191504 RepID=A0AAV5ED53_ELECO|nr:hypothetical protein PR202_gb08485 [Eleusine coracana subsp. coracana]